jgi:putative serine/threonine protein kinase
LQAGEVVSLKGLSERKYCKVLCYPRCEQKEGGKRLKELERLGVKALEFTGKKSVLDVPVLGKGCVGIVVVAYTNSGRAALKIRRVDADRKGMFHEGEMLRRANAIDVGPKLLEISENFLLMELIEGTHFPEWIESLGEREVQSRVRLVLKDVLEQCYRLDEAGLDHGELSNAPKHILVDADDRPFLVDFETASINRRVSNVTSVCQYLLLGSQIADKVKEKLGKVDEKQLIQKLRSYKRERTKENFEKLLEKSRT